MTQILFQPFFDAIENTELQEQRGVFEDAIREQFSEKRHGELRDWLTALDSLPEIKPDEIDLKTQVKLSAKSTLPSSLKAEIDSVLKTLIPWRKGPFQIFDTFIDTEWRSDWKWDRVLPHITPLKNKRVLDVGCGSGYHCWRILGEGADWVLGIDPSPRFVVQFEILKHFMPDQPAYVIPLGIEQLPSRLQFFDTVFSMGVLYHRSSPIDHLKELRDTLKPGGELILETLVIDGDPGQVLVPEDRYAKMRNVWFIPSVSSLMQWLGRCGFTDAKCVDLNITSTEEQRTTAWMPSHSLSDFLNPDDKSRTIEGYPAPKRAVIVAKRKGGQANVA